MDGTDGRAWAPALSALGYVIQILYLYGYVLRTSTSMFLGRSSVHHMYTAEYGRIDEYLHP